MFDPRPIYVFIYLIHIFQIVINRSSRSEVFWEKGGLRNFAKFTEKHLYRSLFFNKVAGLAWLLNKDIYSFQNPVKHQNVFKNLETFSEPPS